MICFPGLSNICPGMKRSSPTHTSQQTHLTCCPFNHQGRNVRFSCSLSWGFNPSPFPLQWAFTCLVCVLKPPMTTLSDFYSSEKKRRQTEKQTAPVSKKKGWRTARSVLYAPPPAELPVSLLLSVKAAGDRPGAPNPFFSSEGPKRWMWQPLWRAPYSIVIGHRSMFSQRANLVIPTFHLKLSSTSPASVCFAMRWDLTWGVFFYYFLVHWHILLKSTFLPLMQRGFFAIRSGNASCVDEFSERNYKQLWFPD